MKLPTLGHSLSSGVLRFELLNFDQGQSFGGLEAEELQRVLKKSKNELRAVVFQSRHSRIFCSGGNLKQYAKLTKARGLRANERIRKALDVLASQSVIKVAAVEGDCFGGGMELLSCFDEVWSVPHALFGFWQRRMALGPGWGGEKRWMQKIRAGTLDRLLLTAETFSASEANKIGLVNKIVPSRQMEAEIQNYLVRELQLPLAPLAALHKGADRYSSSDFSKLWFNPEHKTRLGKN